MNVFMNSTSQLSCSGMLKNLMKMENMEDWDIWEKFKFHAKEFVDLFMIIMIAANNKI